MKTIGIICEYNPLHTGHRKQLRRIREAYGEDCAIVCAMSGNFVQRGAPAIVDKSARAKAAVLCGADLVLELPVTTALSSAEGFAAGGVSVLSRLCSALCFGAEDPDRDALLQAAEGLLDSRFPAFLKEELSTGISFPAARQWALSRLGIEGELLSKPNNILAVEYCKAILSQNSPMEIFPICREGNYHATELGKEDPSATALRLKMLAGEDYAPWIPEEARAILAAEPIHTLTAGERAMLYRLRTMTDGEFEDLPYGSEGLWRGLMHACRREATLEEILCAVKSKRYTRARLDRMVMCAHLGITAQQLSEPAPYVRVLAFNDRGREVLRSAKKTGFFRNPGAAAEGSYAELESRCGNLYGLFRVSGTDCPGMEEKRRLSYLPTALDKRENL